MKTDDGDASLLQFQNHNQTEKTTAGMLFYLLLRTSNISQLYRKIIILRMDSFNFLMGDNSLNMISSALDNGRTKLENGESNSIPFEEDFCKQIVPFIIRN